MYQTYSRSKLLKRFRTSHFGKKTQTGENWQVEKHKPEHLRNTDNWHLWDHLWEDWGCKNIHLSRTSLAPHWWHLELPKWPLQSVLCRLRTEPCFSVVDHAFLTGIKGTKLVFSKRFFRADRLGKWHFTTTSEERLALLLFRYFDLEQLCIIVYFTSINFWRKTGTWLRALNFANKTELYLKMFENYQKWLFLAFLINFCPLKICEHSSLRSQCWMSS